MTRTRSGKEHRKRQVKKPVRFDEQEYGGELRKKSVRYQKFMRSLPPINKYPSDTTLDAKQVREGYKKMKARVAYLEKNNRERQAEINDLMCAYDVKSWNKLRAQMSRQWIVSNEIKAQFGPLQREAKVARARLEQVENKLKTGEPSLAWKECKICTLEFNADEMDNKPRVLNCGHTICHGCIVQMVRTKTQNKESEVRCPFCQKEIRDSAWNLPINYWVLQH